MSEHVPPPRRRRALRWSLGVGGALVLAVGLAEWAGWPFLKGPLESRLQQRLQREVRFGDDFALRLLGSLRLRTDALRIGPPQGAQADPGFSGPLLEAADAWLQVPWSTVFGLMKSGPQAPARITALRFGRADAALQRLPDGRANWTFGSGEKPPDRAAPQLPDVDELVVTSGHLTLRDALTRTSIDADVQTREGERGGDAKGADAGGAKGAGAGGAKDAGADGAKGADAGGAKGAGRSAPAAGGLLVQGRGRHEGRPVAFRFTSSGVLPLVSRGNPDPVPVTMRIEARGATFGFEGTATDLLSFAAVDGDAVLTGPSLAAVGDALGLTLPTTEPFTLKGRLAKSGMVWSLQRADLDVGASRLGGAFKYDRGVRPPRLSGELTGSRLVLADLLPAFGAPPEPRRAAAAPKPPGARVLAQRAFDVPSLHAMDADVKVNLQRAELGSLFRQPLQPLQGQLTLDGGVLALTDLVARTAGGELKGGLRLDARQPQPRWSADLRWAGVDLDQWLRPRNPATREVKPSGEKPSFVTGRLGGHAELQAQGKSTAAMLGSLDGTVQAWVRNGTLSHLVLEATGIDIGQALGVLVKGDDRLPMHCAAVRVLARDGRLTPEVAIVDTPDTTLFLTGEVSLAEERLGLTLTARPKDMSPASLRTPVHVRGTFAHPDIQIDKTPVALKLLGAAALAAVHPLAALIPLFDAGDKELAGGCDRTLQRLRDADGPAGARDAQAPRAGGSRGDAPRSTQRQAAGEPPLRK